MNFVVMPHIYMLPSDMNLRLGKIQGYNNNTLIAPASVHPGIQVGVNRTATRNIVPKQPDCLRLRPDGHPHRTKKKTAHTETLKTVPGPQIQTSGDR